MAMVMKTRNMLEGLVKDGSFKWLLGKRSSFDEEFEEMGRSLLPGRNWIPELSPVANIVVRRCSKILGISSSELQESFNQEASESIKHPSHYARNFLEYCCFRALALSTQVTGHLADKKFRRLTFDMMMAWETPAAASQPLLNVDEYVSIGVEAFSRIAPGVPIIANVIICENLFQVLTRSTGGRLQFTIYDKYLGGLERAIKKMRCQSESSLLLAFRSSTGEKILEVDGTVTTQPVLEHVGISTWPGRLTLTDHAGDSRFIQAIQKPLLPSLISSFSFQLSSIKMSNTCGNCDCADKNQCVKKGSQTKPFIEPHESNKHVFSIFTSSIFINYVIEK